MLPQVYYAGPPLTYDPPKNPNDLDYFGIDWTNVLGIYGDSIAATPVITSSPSGLIISNITYQPAGLVTFYAASGVNGTSYQINCQITTNFVPSGRVLNAVVVLPVLY